MAIAPSPEDQKALYAEADARFWAQTGYRPGQKLDPRNPLDAKMVPTYTNIYNKVLADWRAGKIVWTFDQQLVATLLGAAKDASADAASHVEAAVAAIAGKEPDKAKEHLVAAHGAHTTAQTRTAEAAALQPPTVSHPHVQEAAHQIRQFVMNGAGQGVPVSSGADAVAAMQAQLAPARAESIDLADNVIEQARDLARESAEDRAKASPKNVGSMIAIGASIAAAIGLLIVGVRGPTVISGRPSYSSRSRRFA